MQSVVSRFAGWRGFKAVVVGDFMLDQLVYGDAERLSADAPVPVLLVRRTEERPGGAANVCMDVAALGGEVVAVGVVGADGAGERLVGALRGKGIDPAGIVVDASRPTTQKQNLIGLAQARHPQKMFRVDYESAEPMSREIEDRLLERFEAALGWADVVCLEDYAKGVCSERLCQGVIERARRAGKAVLVDPARRSDYGRYRGCTVMTPNRTEAETATGMSTRGQGEGSGSGAAHAEGLGWALLERLGMEACVVTLDRHGALLVTAGGGGVDARAVAVPTVARTVYDVTGAGDMFLAGLAAARANGWDWESAVGLANTAAGLEVEVFGPEPIPLARVQAAMLERERAGRGKVRTRDEVVMEAAGRRAAGERVVFTNGCFDILHAGHVALLEEAAAQGDFLVVGLNSDASVRRLKGAGRPVNSEGDRARVLGSLGCVGAVVVFDEDTPMELIEGVKPGVLVKGADYTKERVVGGAFVESLGGRVHLVGLVEGRSTTGILKRGGGA